MLLFLAALGLICALALTLAFPRAAAVLWILALETASGTWLDPLTGPAHHEAMIGALKAFGLILTAALILRHGARRDRYNPAFAFATMFLTGLMHGLYPGLTVLSSLRSLIGSAGPFLFSFARLPAGFCAAVIRAVLWAPLASIAAGAILAALGLSHMYVLEQGALRLGGAVEPPVLAGFALAGVYAALVETAAAPRPAVTAALALNFVIILLTGARAPFAIAAVEILLLLLLRRRLLPLAALGAALAAALLFTNTLSFLRVIDLTRLGEAANLSNRDLVWPIFQQAFFASPWFGWGVGAGKIIIPVTSQLHALLGTNAAHDEYLRIGAEGGLFGLTLLILFIALWVRRGTALMPPLQAWLVRLIFIGFAIHSATDNTMIATTSSVFFLWASCIFANTENAPKAAI